MVELENLSEAELAALVKEGRKQYWKEYRAQHPEKVKEQRRKAQQRYFAKRALRNREAKGE